MKLELENLYVNADEKEIVRGVSLSLSDGEFHVLMGPNGSGKSTLARAIMGHPLLSVSQGDIRINGRSIKSAKPDERARLGLFLEFQNPAEIEGLGLLSFLNTARGSLGNDMQFRDFMKEVKERSEALSLKEELIGRSLNHGFSGGEKKKVEILQMALLKPKIAILDEPDSGLDVDAVRIIAENINRLRKESGMGMLLITHYSRILNYMEPQFIHVMKEGRIVRSGGRELIKEIEEKGYNE